MILINKGVSTTFDLTLTERCDLTAPHYLFWFKNEISQREISVILADVSSYTYRFNQFVFIEGTTATMETGYWIYEVYEQASASNTDKDLAYQMVETGKVKVVSSASSTDSVYESNPTTNTVYPA